MFFSPESSFEKIKQFMTKSEKTREYDQDIPRIWIASLCSVYESSTKENKEQHLKILRAYLDQLCGENFSNSLAYGLSALADENFYKYIDGYIVRLANTVEWENHPQTTFKSILTTVAIISKQLYAQFGDNLYLPGNVLVGLIEICHLLGLTEQKAIEDFFAIQTQGSFRNILDIRFKKYIIELSALQNPSTNQEIITIIETLLANQTVKDADIWQLTSYSNNAWDSNSFIELIEVCRLLRLTERNSIEAFLENQTQNSLLAITHLFWYLHLMGGNNPNSSLQLIIIIKILLADEKSKSIESHSLSRLIEICHLSGLVDQSQVQKFLNAQTERSLSVITNQRYEFYNYVVNAIKKVKCDPISILQSIPTILETLHAITYELIEVARSITEGCFRTTTNEQSIKAFHDDDEKHINYESFTVICCLLNLTEPNSIRAFFNRSIDVLLKIASWGFDQYIIFPSYEKKWETTQKDVSQAIEIIKTINDLSPNLLRLETSQFIRLVKIFLLFELTKSNIKDFFNNYHSNAISIISDEKFLDFINPDQNNSNSEKEVLQKEFNEICHNQNDPLRTQYLLFLVTNESILAQIDKQFSLHLMAHFLTNKTDLDVSQSKLKDATYWQALTILSAPEKNVFSCNFNTLFF